MHVLEQEAGSKSNSTDRTQFLNYIEKWLHHISSFVWRESERCPPCSSCNGGNCVGDAMVATWTYSLLLVALMRGTDVVAGLRSEVCCRLGFALAQRILRPCFPFHLI